MAPLQASRELRSEEGEPVFPGEEKKCLTDDPIPVIKALALEMICSTRLGRKACLHHMRVPIV